MPQFLEFEYDDFLRHRDDWLLWRNLGHVDTNGAWIAPVSFTEAQQLPTKMLNVFFSLDDLVEKMMKQKADKNRKR